jgi:hypothetical protein
MQMPEPYYAEPGRKWTIDSFRAFWSKPDISRVPNIFGVLTPDAVGHWPRPIGTIRDPERYVSVIRNILTICPDFSLTIGEYANVDDFHFVRWIASGTDADGAFEFNGCDRVRTRNGHVCENFIFCDHPFFGRVAAALNSSQAGSSPFRRPIGVG